MKRGFEIVFCGKLVCAVLLGLISSCEKNQVRWIHAEDYEEINLDGVTVCAQESERRFLPIVSILIKNDSEYQISVPAREPYMIEKNVYGEWMKVDTTGWNFPAIERASNVASGKTYIINLDLTRYITRLKPEEEYRMCVIYSVRKNGLVYSAVDAEDIYRQYVYWN